MSKQIPSTLRSVSFFRNLSENTLALVFSRMVRRRIPAGSILFLKGEEPRGVYILTGGKVEIFRATADGREQVLHTETPVASVAELPVFDGEPYPASGRTAEDSELYFLSAEDFQRLYREHPEISHAVIRLLGQRLRKLVKVMETISLRSIPGRVAKVLLEVGERSGELRNGHTFRLEKTQTELARELATSRESVARALGDLRRREILSTRGREITILSVSGLVDVARGE